MAKFPIDKWTRFSIGSSKNLTLDECTSIMLDKQVYSWDVALKHVPTRKLFETRLKMMERKLQKQLFLNKTNSAEPLYDDDIYADDAVTPMYEGVGDIDFSHSARAKLRGQWCK